MFIVPLEKVCAPGNKIVQLTLDAALVSTPKDCQQFVLVDIRLNACVAFAKNGETKTISNPVFVVCGVPMTKFDDPL